MGRARAPTTAGGERREPDVRQSTLRQARGAAPRAATPQPDVRQSRGDREPDVRQSHDGARETFGTFGGAIAASQMSGTRIDGTCGPFGARGPVSAHAPRIQITHAAARTRTSSAKATMRNAGVCASLRLL